MQSIEQLAETFRDVGYVIIPGAFSREMIARWRSRRFFTKRAEYDILRLEPDSLIPAACCSRHVDLAEHLLGGPAQIDDVLLKVFPPLGSDPGHGQIDWHRDRWAHFPDGQGYTRPNAVSVLVYLQDLTDDVGPLRVIPRSHREHVEVPREQVASPHPQELLLHLRAGDAVVFHNCLLHAGSPNHSNDDRCFVSFSYNDYSVPVALERGAWCEGAAASADRRTRRLLGLDPFAVTQRWLMAAPESDGVASVGRRRAAGDERVADAAENQSERLERRWIHDAELRARARSARDLQGLAADLCVAPSVLSTLAHSAEVEARTLEARRLRDACVQAVFPRSMKALGADVPAPALLEAFDAAFPGDDRRPELEVRRFLAFASTVCVQFGIGQPALTHLRLEALAFELGEAAGEAEMVLTAADRVALGASVGRALLQARTGATSAYLVKRAQQDTLLTLPQDRLPLPLGAEPLLVADVISAATPEQCSERMAAITQLTLERWLQIAP